MKLLHKEPPSEIFKKYRPKSVIAFEPWMEPLLFWKSGSKLIHDDGGIVRDFTFTRGGQQYRYTFQVTDMDVFWNHKNSRVRFFYKIEDLSKVYLFELKTWKFIGVIKGRLVLNEENKEEVLKEQRRILREIDEERRKFKKEDENLEAGLPADFGLKMPNLDAEIMRSLMKGMEKKKKEKGEVDISKIKIQSQ